MNNNKRCSKQSFLMWHVFLLFLTLGLTDTVFAEADPLESINRPIYNFNDALDRHVMQPIARGYTKITPEPVRDRITNFFNNLTYLNVILNDFLQGKFHQGIDDSARFFINSTVGLGGLFDPASTGGLVQHNEDFGQTLGVWGMDEVAYLVLPLLGPSSVRDVPDLATSTALNPLTYFTFAIAAPISAVNIVNSRANLLEATEFRDEAALDPYVFTREAYRQHRISLIYDGNPPTQELEDFFDDEEDALEEDTLIIE